MVEGLLENIFYCNIPVVKGDTWTTDYILLLLCSFSKLHHYTIAAVTVAESWVSPFRNDGRMQNTLIYCFVQFLMYVKVQVKKVKPTLALQACDDYTSTNYQSLISCIVNRWETHDLKTDWTTVASEGRQADWLFGGSWSVLCWGRRRGDETRRRN